MKKDGPLNKFVAQCRVRATELPSHWFLTLHTRWSLKDSEDQYTGLRFSCISCLNRELFTLNYLPLAYLFLIRRLISLHG